MSPAEPEPEPAPAPAPVPELAYASAVAELEAILAELEDDRVDVDALSDKVRRAAALIHLCRSRIEQARMDVERIVASLSPPDS